MKKFFQALAVTVLAASSISGLAAANSYDSYCDISNTGTDSYNECESEVENDVRVTCKNGIYVVNDNDQGAESGDTEVDENTSGGDATSGSAINENGTVVQIGASCGTTTTSETPTTPEGGSGGQVQSASTTATQVVAPAGGVHAGTGSTASNAGALTAILGSTGLLALGLSLRNRILGRL